MTSAQWQMALHDGDLSSVCEGVDTATVQVLTVRALPLHEVGRCLPRLLGELSTAAWLVEQTVGDLGRFAPPGPDEDTALAVVQVGRLTRNFVAEIEEWLAQGLHDATWATARGHLLERDDLLAGIAASQTDREDDNQRFERSLGLSTSDLRGDGLTFAARVAAAWAKQPEVLDGRLYAQLPHLLDPSVPLSSKVRVHLAWLSVSSRPLVAHQAAIAGRDLVRRALAADPESCLSTIAEQVTHEPVMYFTHQGLLEALKAFSRASDPREQMRPALQMYNPVMEGDVRRVARTVLQLLGRPVDAATTLTALAEQLAANSNEAICALLASCVQTSWRNAIAHEQVWWDSHRQCAMLAGEPIEPSRIADVALRAREICAGFETGVAVALNDAGNPHARLTGGTNEIARSISVLLAMGEAGISVSALRRDGTTMRLTVPPFTIQSMTNLLIGIVNAAMHDPDVAVWDIRQTTTGRAPFQITRDAVDAAWSIAHTDDTGQRVIEMPFSGLPLVLSGLIQHDPASTSTVSSTIALAAVNIIGEHGRLRPKFASEDPQALADFMRTVAMTARAVDAAARISNSADRHMLQAFGRLVAGLEGQLTEDPSAVAAAELDGIELAFRSSAPAHLPWLVDALTDTR